MDHLSISALSPQEDEFALLALGVPSIYRGFLDPRRLPELSQWLDPAVWASGEPPGWTTAWQEFLSGVVAGRSGRLTLKSPSHTFRVRALTEFFPKASYVWLIRDPVATFLSNRKMWLAMFERYALWPWDFSTLDDFLCQAFIFAAQCLSEATALLPREHLVVVSFEQLTHTTLATVEGINRRLSLGRWDQIYAAIEQMVAAKADYRPATYDRTQLPAGALKAAEKLLAAQTSALATHGLTPPA